MDLRQGSDGIGEALKTAEHAPPRHYRSLAAGSAIGQPSWNDTARSTSRNHCRRRIDLGGRSRPLVDHFRRGCSDPWSAANHSLGRGCHAQYRGCQAPVRPNRYRAGASIEPPTLPIRDLWPMGSLPTGCRTHGKLRLARSGWSVATHAPLYPPRRNHWRDHDFRTGVAGTSRDVSEVRPSEGPDAHKAPRSPLLAGVGQPWDGSIRLFGRSRTFHAHIKARPFRMARKGRGLKKSVRLSPTP